MSPLKYIKNLSITISSNKLLKYVKIVNNRHCWAVGL